MSANCVENEVSFHVFLSDKFIFLCLKSTAKFVVSKRSDKQKAVNQFGEFPSMSTTLYFSFLQLDLNEQKNENELEVPMDYSIKHPLQNCWTLWYFENDRSLPWEQNQKQVSSFDTVEDFWRYAELIIHIFMFLTLYFLVYTTTSNLPVN